MSTFDALVNELVSRGFSRDVAEAEVMSQHPTLAPKPAAVERDASVREKAEQAFIAKLARAYGFKVRSTSQSRASKVAPGIGDLILMHRRRRLALWWETKRQVGGKLSPSQLEFEDDCRVCGWTYRSGDRHDFARYLINLGLAEGGDGPCNIVPVHEPRNLERVSPSTLHSAELR